MLQRLRIIFIQIRISILNATYHRNMKHAEQCRAKADIIKFKKHVYAAEDAWRKLVILMQKIKK